MFSNRQQRLCLVLAAIIGVGMVLFPPWRSFEQVNMNSSQGIRGSEDAGYHFLFAPPPPKPASNIVKTWVAMHVERLLLQLLALVGALAGLLLILRDPRTPKGAEDQANE